MNDLFSLIVGLNGYWAGFIVWLYSLSTWDLILIIGFTVALDIGRNIGKCSVLTINEIKKKINPIKLNNSINPKISVIIPAHNESVSIQKTISSVLDNTYKNKEIIVVDDHSTDDTYQRALQYYQNQQIKLIQRKEGKGSKSAAINYGINFATGDYIMVMDGDTLLEKNALSEVAKYLTLPGVIAVSGNVRILSGDGGIKNILTRFQSYEYLIAFELGRRYNALMNMLLLIPGAFGVFSRKMAENVGYYDKDTIGEDFDLTVKLLKISGKVEYVSNAIALTYCPNNWHAWIRQRVRWAHGQFSTLLKHNDVLSSKKYRRRFVMAVYDMIIMDMFLLALRLVAWVWLAFNFSETVFYVYTLIFLLYFANEFIVITTAAAFSPRKSDLKYVYLAPLVVVFYRPFYTVIRSYAYFKRLIQKEIKW